MKPTPRLFLLSVFALLCLMGVALAATSTPGAKDSAFDKAGEALDRAKQEVQDLRDKWDKARLEVTLYDKRAKRAYEKWVKAKQKMREQAKDQKEKAELELQLSIEKRKLAFNEWQAAQLREVAKESELKALEQEKDAQEIEGQIKKIEEKLGRPSMVDSQPKN